MIHPNWHKLEEDVEPEEVSEGVSKTSKRLRKLIDVLGASSAILWFGLLSKNDYANITHSGPVSAITVIEEVVNIKGNAIDVDSVLG